MEWGERAWGGGGAVFLPHSVRVAGPPHQPGLAPTHGTSCPPRKRRSVAALADCVCGRPGVLLCLVCMELACWPGGGQPAQQFRRRSGRQRSSGGEQGVGQRRRRGIGPTAPAAAAPRGEPVMGVCVCSARCNRQLKNMAPAHMAPARMGSNRAEHCTYHTSCVPFSNPSSMLAHHRTHAAGPCSRPHRSRARRLAVCAAASNADSPILAILFDLDGTLASSEHLSRR